MFKTTLGIVCAGLLLWSASGATLSGDRASNAPYQPGINGQMVRMAGPALVLGPSRSQGTAGVLSEEQVRGKRQASAFSQGTVWTRRWPIAPSMAHWSRGQIFSLDLGSTSVGVGGVVGLNLLSGAATVFTFKYADGQSFWQLNDGGSDFDTNPPFAANTLIHFAFTFNGGQSYSILITEGANTYSGPNFNASGVINSIDGVKMFSSQQGAGQNLGFNNLAIVPEPSTLSLLIGAALLSACYFRTRRRVA